MGINTKDKINLWLLQGMILLLCGCLSCRQVREDQPMTSANQEAGADSHTSVTSSSSVTSVTSCKSGQPERFGPAGSPAPAASQPAATLADLEEIPDNTADNISDNTLDNIPDNPVVKAATQGMVRIPGGTFMMGADNEQARADEFPKHSVTVAGFYMDRHEVTNAQFQEFVEATGYRTTAEMVPDWGALKKQLPPGTPKPAEELLVASSLVFRPTSSAVPLNNPAQWWHWVSGASWKQPEGPGSSIEGKDHYPVVHVSWDDAAAYARWAGKRLPTEAEWEWAARGGKEQNIYPWGNENLDTGKPKANTWQGDFPYRNTERDHYPGLAPVKSFPPNGYGLYDMAGNVWEWCADWYHAEYYQVSHRREGIENPQGPAAGYDPMEPRVPKKVIRGGSFLCHDAYCSGYRVAARMKSSPDTGLSHTGFRCVKDVND